MDDTNPTAKAGNQITFTIPGPEDCRYQMNYEPETSSIREAFRECLSEEQINSLIEEAARSVSAWFQVECVCTWNGFQENSFLGCCSYESLEAFERGPCFEGLKKEAYEQLIAAMQGFAD